MRAVLFLFCCSLGAQVADKANERYRNAEGREAVARGLTDANRDARQKPKELVAALGIKPGMTVVDLGTGAGYMLPYLSAAVGDRGKVIAEDIYPDFLTKAKQRARDLKNVEFVLGSDKQSNLPQGAVDIILALDVYHHFDYPAAVLADLRSKLKPGGRLILVEYHKNEKAMPDRFALEHIRLGADDAVKEIESNGFRLISRRDFVPEVQWLGVFEAK